MKPQNSTILHDIIIEQCGEERPALSAQQLPNYQKYIYSHQGAFHFLINNFIIRIVTTFSITSVWEGDNNGEWIQKSKLALCNIVLLFV